MPASPSCVKQPILVVLFCLITLLSKADTLTLSQSFAPSAALPLQPYLSAWEDTTGKATAGDAIHLTESFVPLHLLQRHSPTSVYWLKMTITNAATFDPSAVLRFSNLTHVEAFLYRQDTCVWQRLAGAFRPRSLIEKEDSRFHVLLSLVPGQTHTLLLRVHHTKGYQPNFDFSLQQKDAFVQKTHTRERTDAWTQGAVAIFFFYTLLSWLVSRYRPYLWLLLFIGGVGLYGICSGPYFIDWFFPEHPATGWLFNVHFLHLGLLGFYLLVADFWQLPEHNPRLFRLGQVCIAVLVLLSVSGFLINYCTGNFNLTNTLNLWAFLFPFGFAVSLLVRCFHRLNRAQKYLYYGIVLFLAASLFITLSSAFFSERSLLTAPYVSNFTTLAVFLLFSTGLKEALRQHEIDKLAVLQQLTALQKQQNSLLENKVEERTRALQQSNEELQAQASLLAKRSATIETLINELSHRVKNNLQLLYSLSSLQLPNVRDEATTHILKGNMARIRAMMLVNQKLDYVSENNQVHLTSLIHELTGHLQAIYDRSKSVKIIQSVPDEIELPSRQILSLGLILTELITNSFKYAFHHCMAPSISIEITLSDTRQLKLVYADNGSGMANAPAKHAASMGLSLVKDLTRQLNGTVSTMQEEGLSYTFVIPV